MSRAALRHSFYAIASCLVVAGIARAEPPGDVAAPPAGDPVSLQVYPSDVTLSGPRAGQRLVVVGRFADGREWDLSRSAVIEAADPRLVRVEHGVITPLADGQTRLTVKVGAARATVPVTLKQVQADLPVDFTTEVEPVLTKAGCNQGACHGAQHGRGGFKLSLFGFDPDFDHAQIVKSAEGRRVVPSDPERSILLLKPSLQLEHGGGERLPASSRGYRVLEQWLADGAPPPRPDDPTVVRLEVLPPRRLLVVGEEQQLAVRATWSNGRSEDVTASAQFDSLNEALASAKAEGLVRANGRGETYVMVRFAGQATVFQATVPFRPPTDFAFERKNFIDDLLAAKWKSLGLSPSPVCSDAEFLRRASLDTIGTLPTPEEVRAFLADGDPQKRAKAVDRLLERPEFVDFWALKWGDLLRNHRNFLEEKGMWSLHNWLRAQIRDNRPVDEFVRDIVTAVGSTYIDGPANFYRVGNSPADWAETTSQLFLGVRIGCAKCHHHPFEKWSQDDYYGLAAFFARMGTKTSQEFGLFGQERVVYLRPGGEQTHPRKGGVVKPRVLDGPPVDDPFDRRTKLADWLTAKDNPFFARNMANRFWGYFMGRGLVEPLDDLRATNPASCPELLDALAADFAAHGFILKHLMRTILTSTAYQLGSAVTPGNEADKDGIYHARHIVRRLTAEQMADAVDFATGSPEKYPGLPPGTRAIQLPDSGVRSYFLDTFGRPARQIACECERSMVPNIAQALHLANGDFVNAKIARKDGRIDKLFQAKKPLTEVVEELFLVTLSRPPRAEELEKALAWIAKAPNPRAGAEDLLWVLLNSREFLFNH